MVSAGNVFGKASSRPASRWPPSCNGAGAAGCSLNHLPIPASLRKNITIATYDSGHMMYLLDKDAAKLREDIVGWLK